MEQQIGYRETELGWLPDEWEVVTIGDVFNVQQGKQLSAKEKPDGKTKRPFLRTSNVFWQRIALSKVDEMYFTEDEFQKLKLQNNDILLCEGGDVGRTAVWHNEIEECVYQNHLHRLRPKTPNYEPDFFVNWMEFAILQQKNYVMSANRTTIPNLSQSRLKRFEIPLPPLPEQRKIAAVLAAVQEARDRTEQVITALQVFKQSLMQHLFTYGPVPVDAVDRVPLQETEIGMMPEGWEVDTLRNVCEKIQDGTHFSPKTKEDGEVMYITSKNIRPFRLDLTNVEFIDKVDHKKIYRRCDVKKRDLLFTKDGVNTGNCVVNPLNEEFSLLSSVCLIRPKVNLSNHFLCQYINSSEGRRLIRSDMGGSAINRLTVKKILNIKVPLPPLPTQHQIAEILLAVEEKIEKEQNEKAALDSLFQSMLDALMTAKLRVNNLEV